MGGVRFGFDPSVPAGQGRVQGAEIMAFGEWVPLEGYNGTIVFAADTYITSGDNG